MFLRNESPETWVGGVGSFLKYFRGSIKFKDNRQPEIASNQGIVLTTGKFHSPASYDRKKWNLNSSTARMEEEVALENAVTSESETESTSESEDDNEMNTVVEFGVLATEPTGIIP